MSPIFFEKTSHKTSLTISKVDARSEHLVGVQATAKEEKKGFLAIFKSFLLVGGDLV